MSTTPPLSNPPSETDPLAPSPAPSAFERAKLRKAALQARAQEVADRAESARAPLSLSKEGTYGALGIAAALLFGLYLVARLIVGAAVINATPWDRQARARAPESDSITA